MTPDQVIGSKFTIDALSLLFIAGRLFATRKVARTKESIIAHVMLFLTVAADLTATIVFVWIMNEQNKLIDKFDGDPMLVAKGLMNPDYSRVFYIAHFFYFHSLYFLKGAFLAYYGQLFIRTQTKKRYMLYAGIAVTVLCYFIGLITLLFWCQPLTDNWNPMPASKNCPTVFNFNAFALMASVNIVSDLAIVTVPLVVISNLRLDRREIVGLICIFVIGGSSVLASVVRFVIIGKALLAKEFTWAVVHTFALVSHAEVLFGIIAFSLPAFRPFLRSAVQSFSKLGSKWTTGASNSTGYKGSSGSRSEYKAHDLKPHLTEEEGGSQEALAMRPKYTARAL